MAQKGFQFGEFHLVTIAKMLGTSTQNVYDRKNGDRVIMEKHREKIKEFYRMKIKELEVVLQKLELLS